MTKILNSIPFWCLCHLVWVSHISRLDSSKISLKISSKEILPQKQELPQCSPMELTTHAGLSLGCHLHVHRHTWHLNVPVSRNTKV